MKRWMILLCLVLVGGCRSGPDFEVLRSEILELHRATIEAHWNKDVDYLMQGLSEGFFSVGNGAIQHPAREEMTARLTEHLDNTTFAEYKDLRDPIIGFSRDGSLAWSVVQVKVAGRRTADDGSASDLDFTCAWLTLYERTGEGWERLTEVSTFKQ